jgi:phenylalanyl-tRNA synthetase beta chain
LIEELLRQLGLDKATFNVCTDNPSFHPGKTAKIYNDDSEIGIMGCIHPDVAKNSEAPLNTIVIMLDAGILTKGTERAKSYKQLPKFPSITRDLSIIADKGVTSSLINEVIKKYAGQYLESIKLFDVYTGKQIDQSKKSISYQLVFRSNSGTLTDDIINPEIEKVISALATELSATLR